jgi:hypothetical protein
LEGWAIDGAFLAGIALLQFSAIAYFSYLRWYHTNLRDPTVQFCVMLAEQNRDTINALRPKLRL